MPTRIDRVVKHPPEGLYLFRFELKAPDGRLRSLATDKHGRGLFILHTAPRPSKAPEDGATATPPTNAWRALCFAAKRKDMLEQTLIRAEPLLAQTAIQFPPGLTAQDATHQLSHALEQLGWGPVSPSDKIVYLDNSLRVRNKGKPFQEPT